MISPYRLPNSVATESAGGTLPISSSAAPTTAGSPAAGPEIASPSPSSDPPRTATAMAPTINADSVIGTATQSHPGPPRDSAISRAARPRAWRSPW